MKEVLEKILELMKDKDDFNKKGTVIPVVAVFVHKHTNEIVDYKINQKPKNREMNKYHDHAEMLLLKNKDNIKKIKNLEMIVSIPPCRHCIKEMISNGYEGKIIYLSKYGQKHKFFLQREYGINFKKYKPIDRFEREMILKISNPLKPFIDDSANKSGNKESK